MNNRKVLLFTAGLLTVMITLACQNCHATRILMHNVSSEYKLRRELLTNYDHLVRPVLSPPAVVNVSFLVKLLSIVDVDSKNEVITSKVLIEQIWENPYLKWDQSHFEGINRVRMSNDEVWVPDIKLQNSANNPSQDTQHLHENWVTVYSNGTNVWVSIAMIYSKCDFDISVFPFDEQKCSIIFASESYDTELLDIYLKQGDRLNLGKKSVKEYLKSTNNGEWKTGSFTAIREVQSTCCSTPFVHVTINLHITRIPTFYILYLLCPFIVLTLLVFFSFIIPPDNGERIGFCSSLLLSLSVYLLLFSELMPNNSRKLNIFGVAFVLIFLESAAVLVATLFVLKAYHATGEIPAVFKLLHYCSFSRLGSSMKKQYPLDRAKKNKITNRSHSLNEEEGPPLSIKPETAAEDISLANVNQETRVREQHEPDEEPGDQLTWLKVARRLDRFFFWCFLFAFVVTVSIIGMLNQDLGEAEITI